VRNGVFLPERWMIFSGGNTPYFFKLLWKELEINDRIVWKRKTSKGTTGENAC
jgi:hypothetical protein